MPRDKKQVSKCSSRRRNTFLALLLVIPIMGMIGESAWTLSQDSELVSQFKSQGSPVQRIQVKDGIAMARLAYRTGESFTLERLEKEIIPLLGKLSEHYPEAEKIALESYIEDKSVGTIECPAKKAIDFAKGQITMGELLSSARVTGSLNIEEELAAVMADRTLPLEKDSPGNLLPEKVREGSERRVASQGARRTALSGTSGGGLSGTAGGLKPTARFPQGIFFVFLTLGALCLVLVGAILAMRNKKREPRLKAFARLDIRSRDGARKDFVIQGHRTAIGRAPGNNLMIHDPDVSGRHAAIVVSNGVFIIEDLGSTNGTYLNGRKISRERLYIGDEITVGGAQIIVGD